MLDPSDEPPTKCFCHLDKLLSEILKEGIKQKAALPSGLAEVERYFDTVESLAESVDLDRPSTEVSP